jgi:argininosuccinate lyase
MKNVEKTITGNVDPDVLEYTVGDDPVLDRELVKWDAAGTAAHVTMLSRMKMPKGVPPVVTPAEAAKVRCELAAVVKEFAAGKFEIREADQDVHMAVERRLTATLGDLGKKIHTGRSRNDQVATDIRLTLRKECDEVMDLLRHLTDTIFNKAHEHENTILPGYTHLQRAQPIFFAHHLLAYCMMFMRDVGRLEDAVQRMNVSPLGACALAGTSYPIDRDYTAALLGFSGPMPNSIDAVSDRDFCVELLAALSTVMVHLSRFSEEIILWSGFEFRFIELDDAFTTGSSIMPQKKNPDMAELVRGKAGRVFGSLTAMFTALKGLPLAYNKDMQEDKEAVFDAVDTVKACLGILALMLAGATVHTDAMLHAAQTGFINATDLADYLVRKGLPFRDAYGVAGKLVAHCTAKGCVLETLPLEDYRTFSDLFDEDVYAAVDLHACAEKRTSYGGTSVASVEEQIRYVREQIAK